MTQPTTDEALLRLSRALGQRFGIVRAVEVAEPDAADPPVTIAFSHPGRVLGTPDDAVNEGGGASMERDVAIVKAIAESVERYCAAAPPTGALRSSWRRMAARSLEPSSFALFDERQYQTPGFPFRRFDADTIVSWACGTSLVDGGPTWVPAPFVFLPYRRPAAEPRITTAISTGLAAGLSPATAQASALLEVIERDAFMLTWRHRLASPAIDLDSLPPGTERRLVSALRSTGLACHALLLTRDIAVPVAGIVLQGVAPHQALVVLGAGASASPLHALRLALEEACLSLFGMNRLIRDARRRTGGSAGRNLTSLASQSVAFATTPALAATANFLVQASSGKEAVTIDHLDQQFADTADGSLDAVLASLPCRAEHPVVVDLTQPEVRDIGIHVVRVVVPGLRPLDHDASVPHLGGTRWLDCPRYEGPHPFP